MIPVPVAPAKNINSAAEESKHYGSEPTSKTLRVSSVRRIRQNDLQKRNIINNKWKEVI